MNARRSTGASAGSLLLEVGVAVFVVAVGILGLLSALRVSAVATAGIDELDRVGAAFDNAVEALRRTRFAEIYARYHGARLPAEGLVGPSGGEATVLVACCVDERRMPEEFGPVLDIDGQEGLRTQDCSTTYKIIPVRFSLTYRCSTGDVTLERHVVLEPSR
ncbi:MAG: hypothetical protein HY721_30315 [Planctomycetes bacterium]|nr:hypothetical protein [Planctomycetota bacterium]